MIASLFNFLVYFTFDGKLEDATDDYCLHLANKVFLDAKLDFKEFFLGEIEN